MKNSAVKAMIVNQFNYVDPNDIRVEFVYSDFNKENYKVVVIDNGEVRTFELSVEMKEIK